MNQRESFEEVRRAAYGPATAWIEAVSDKGGLEPWELDFINVLALSDAARLYASPRRQVANLSERDLRHH